VMGNERADLAAAKVTGNVDMAWNLAKNNTFSRICKSSIIHQDFLYQIYFEFKPALSLHGVGEDFCQTTAEATPSPILDPLV